MITGNKIKLARQLKNIQQKEMADRLSMDHSTYSRLERGETKLTEERVENILKVLDIRRDFVEQIELHMEQFRKDELKGMPLEVHSFQDDTLSRTLQLVNEQIQNQNKLIESFIEIMNRR